MADDFSDFRASLESPAANAAAVAPSDDTPLVTVPRALWVGGTGSLKVDMIGGQTVTFAAVPVGFMPIRVTKVHATGTSATSIVAVW